jgi:predicted CXXCH cytochrome family protein
MNLWSCLPVFAMMVAALPVFPAQGAAALTGCLKCHDVMRRDKFVHNPVADGECVSCHQPVAGKKHPGEKGAVTLIAQGARLCFGCHDPDIVEGESVHPPVAAGDCLGCHQPHGSRFPKLLKREFPEEFYLPYSPDNFALCFECHSREMVEDRRTDTLTGFRNGDRNLHYLHVNRLDKGRSCKVCHEPHASSQAKLIKVKVSGFGKWEIPIIYTRKATGGTCVVGCHKPRSYDRVRPAIY